MESQESRSSAAQHPSTNSAGHQYDFERIGDRTLAEQHFADFTSSNDGIPDPHLARIVRVDRGLPLAVSARGVSRVEPARHLIESAATSSMARACIGDWVVLGQPQGHEMPLIEGVLPRRGTFSRRDPAEAGGEQVVIANVDVVFVVHSIAGRGVNPSRLERELVLAFESGADPVIVLTKADLVSPDEVAAQLEVATPVSAGVPIIIESAVTMEGVDDVRALIPAGVTAAMIGPSGVGKSTLANRLIGSEVQDTAAVRDGDMKGRHTTVARELVHVPGGGVLIDTPGMRGIGLWRADAGLDLAFPEIAAAASACKFRDCSHGAEPGCQVRAAIESGHLDHRRVQRYRALQEELTQQEQAEQVRRRRQRK